MLIMLIISLIIVLLAVLLLGVRVFFVRGGKFPSTHIEANKALREKGIHCVNSQMESEARQKNLFDRIDAE
jgi:hypothetical protein